MTFDSIFVGEQRSEFFGAKKAERRFEHRADLVAGFQDIDGILLHQVLETFGERGFATAHRPKQIKNLPPLLEALCRMLEVADNTLDRVLHAEEPVEGAVNLDRAVEENAAETGILGGVDEFRFSDRCDHSFRGTRVQHAIVARGQQPVPQAHRLQALSRIISGEDVEHIKRAHHDHHSLYVTLAFHDRYRGPPRT